MVKSKKKQSFLLLELLIALSLFCLCVLPLAQLPFNALRAEIKSCQRMQLQRLADLTFADIEAQLFQHAISWKELSVTKKEKTELLKDKLTVHLKGIGDREFARSCSIWTSRHKEGKNREQYRLVTIELQLKALTDSHFFFKKKKNSDTTTFRHQVFVLQQQKN
jgi:hypothetical protein